MWWGVRSMRQNCVLKVVLTCVSLCFLSLSLSFSLSLSCYESKSVLLHVHFPHCIMQTNLLFFFWGGGAC